MKSFVHNMDAFFSTSSRSGQQSPAKKLQKGDQPESMPATQEWVKNGLAAALGAMGDAVEGRVQVAEAKVEQQGKDIAAMGELKDDGLGCLEKQHDQKQIGKYLTIHDSLKVKETRINSQWKCQDIPIITMSVATDFQILWKSTTNS